MNTSEHTDRITRHSPPKTINRTWPDTRAPHFRTCVVATCWLLLSLVQRRGVPGGVGDRRSRSPARRIADRTSSRDAAAAVTSHQLHGRLPGRGRIWLAGARAAQEPEGQEDGGKGTGCGEDAGVGCDQLAGLVNLAKVVRCGPVVARVFVAAVGPAAQGGAPCCVPVARVEVRGVGALVVARSDLAGPFVRSDLPALPVVCRSGAGQMVRVNAAGQAA
mmetsp:Transcript_13169/g.42095  ORF Transcript_13169/g.42095 Transcript_13169/m.42095 type:complete len:219 (-) Transcript_13169:37-693(-)